MGINTRDETGESETSEELARKSEMIISIKKLLKSVKTHIRWKIITDILMA